MKGFTIYVTPEIVPYIDQVRKQRQDESRSHTARVLLREALRSRGLLNESECPKENLPITEVEREG